MPGVWFQLFIDFDLKKHRGLVWKWPNLFLTKNGQICIKHLSRWSKPPPLLHEKNISKRRWSNRFRCTHFLCQGSNPFSKSCHGLKSLQSLQLQLSRRARPEPGENVPGADRISRGRKGWSGSGRILTQLSHMACHLKGC